MEIKGQITEIIYTNEINEMCIRDRDIDSTPDNVKTDDYDKQQEDDDDKALVILELKTGGSTSYIWLGLVVLTIIAGGVLLIKKFVI